MHTQTLLQKLKAFLLEHIEKDYSVSEISFEITPPTDKTKADLVTNVAFMLAKMAKSAPVAVATQLAEHVNASDLRTYFHAEAAAPGFVNFTLQDAFLQELLAEISEDPEQYGRNTTFDKQTLVVEHTSPNPNKAMHVGHLRNNVIGMSIANIAEFSGAKVIRDMVDNNRGIAIAKAMWGFLAHKKKDAGTLTDLHYWYQHPEAWLTPEEAEMKADHFVGDCYTLGNIDYKNDPTVAEQTKSLVVAWEEKDAEVWKLWELMIGYAHAGIEHTLSRLGNKWDHQWHEHEHYQSGKDLIEAGLASGVFKRLADGAVLSQLEEYKLPDTIVLKSDGTSLYITQDIALTKLKKEEYQADKLLWVIGPEQGNAMKQVFAICEQLGIGTLDSFTHVPYGLVQITDAEGNAKKMSSRGDEVILIDDLIEQVRTGLSSTDRGYDEPTLESLAISAIKYAMLRAGRTSNITLDLENTVSMDGDSGVYILYTLGRMHSLLGKKADLGAPTAMHFEDVERKLLAHLLYFPHTIQTAAKDYAPNLIVDYLLNLSQLFNSLYNLERFITEDEEKTNKKLQITRAAAFVYKNALLLLGIEPLERI